jgi:hypothetical protein
MVNEEYIKMWNSRKDHHPFSLYVIYVIFSFQQADNYYQANLERAANVHIV